MKSGVRELRIPAMALLMCCCALANKKAGIALLHNPTTNSQGSLDQSMRRRANQSIGTKARAEIDIRRQATWVGWKALRLFLIRIKEVPQIILSTPRVTNARCREKAPGSVEEVCTIEALGC